MKRILLTLVLICLLGPHFVLAQNHEEINDSLVNDIISTGEKLNEFNEDQNKSSYLQEEWGKILEGNKAGKIILGASNFLKRANPLIEKVIGIPYTPSWSFLFALIIWFTIAGFVWKPLKELLENNVSALAISFGIATTLGFLGFIRITVELLSKILTKWWFALIGFALGLIAFLFFERLGKIIAQKIKQSKEKKEKERERESRNERDVETQITKKLREHGIIGATSFDGKDSITGPGLD